MQNEPNLKNTKINLTSFTEMNYVIFHPLQRQKNEPNTNPIVPAILSIYAIACALGGKYLSVLCALGGFEQKMQNEPNLKNAQINVRPVVTEHYENNRPSSRRQNEPNLRRIKPNSNPILRKNKPIASGQAVYSIGWYDDFEANLFIFVFFF